MVAISLLVKNNKLVQTGLFLFGSLYFSIFFLPCFPAAIGSNGPDGHGGVHCEKLWMAGVRVRIDVVEHHCSNIWIGIEELVFLLGSLANLLFQFI